MNPSLVETLEQNSSFIFRMFWIINDRRWMHSILVSETSSQRIMAAITWFCCPISTNTSMPSSFNHEIPFFQMEQRRWIAGWFLGFLIWMSRANEKANCRRITWRNHGVKKWWSSEDQRSQPHWYSKFSSAVQMCWGHSMLTKWGKRRYGSEETLPLVGWGGLPLRSSVLLHQ